MRAPFLNRPLQIVRDYVAWWAAQMRDLLPGHWGEIGGESRDALLIAPDAIDATLWAVLRRDGRSTPLGQFPADKAGIAALHSAAGLGGRQIAVCLQLPAPALLAKPLIFPLAAERELRRALTYEMDRETPYTADEVWWSWRIDQRDKARGQLRLTLFLIPKTAGEPFIALLRQGGLNPTSIGVAGGDGDPPPISLAGDAGVPRRQSGWSRPLAIACAALALIAIIVPFARQSLALARADGRIAALKGQVEAVQQLRRRLDNGAGAPAAADRGGSVQMLKILAETTRVLPDDTHLTDFSLHRRTLTISGQSADAARLIGLLAGNDLFKDPAFAAAVTRQPGSKLDSFALTAEVRR